MPSRRLISTNSQVYWTLLGDELLLLSTHTRCKTLIVDGDQSGYDVRCKPVVPVDGIEADEVIRRHDVDSSHRQSPTTTIFLHCVAHSRIFISVSNVCVTEFSDHRMTSSSGQDQGRGGSSTSAKELLDALGGKSTVQGTSGAMERTSHRKPSIYEALGVAQEATEHEIRKAYFKLAVKVHPDRNPDDPQATERFQSLQKIYTLLIDPEKRRVYDQTGCVDDDEMLSEERFESLYEYYKKQFKEVTVDAIEEFKTSYQMSEEEMNDVLCYYEEFKGDMNAVFDHVMLSEADVDSERFQTYIEDALKDGRLSSCYDTYVSWKEKVSKKKRKRAVKNSSKGDSQKRGKKRVSEGRGSKASSSLEDLGKAIMAKKRNGLHAFAEKYGCGMLDDDPLASEEEFQQARARLDARKAAKK